MFSQNGNCKTTLDLYTRTMKTLVIVVLFCMGYLTLGTEASRYARGVMLSMPGKRNTNCIDLTTVEKNATSMVILTGTVKSCDSERAGSYKCNIQIWRIMKGKKFSQDLVRSNKLGNEGFLFKRETVDIYGLGNIMYCDSDVGDEDTRIFFLNRLNNRLVLSASLVHITLANLENTQAVIEGKNIVDPPKKKPDPCINVLCGFGSTCSSIEGNATCMCPPVSCSSEVEDELFAPLCGSDGITYPNECRLRSAECMSQRRIRIVEETPCAKTTRPHLHIKPTTLSVVDNDDLYAVVDHWSRAPVVDRGLCADVECANSAECVVRIQPNGASAPSCVCPTCDETPALPLCGSDQRSHRSECDMRRTACLDGVEITVVRSAPCNPCDFFNDTTQQFENSCPGVCAFSEDGVAVCCGTLPCVDDGQVVCGSDGNSYASKCVMERQACETARNLSVIKQGLCPLKKVMTTVRGAMAIEADSSCPGGCDPESREFQDFVEILETTVNSDLQQKNLDSDLDSDEALTLGEFKVTGTRPGSVILLFKAYASTRSLVITGDDQSDSNTAWVYNRLFDSVDGALVTTVGAMNISFAPARNPADDFVVEDVCLTEQCSYGASCNIAVSGSRFRPACSCDNLGDPGRLSVTHACKKASDGDDDNHTFLNIQAARRYACNSRMQLTFIDVCLGVPLDPCASQGGCHGEGQSCVVLNGQPMCECITCNDVYKPVCTADGQTFKSACEVHRHNCLSSGDLVIARHDGPCVSECDGVICAPGEQCEVNNGAVCVCPTKCIAARSPVCGTDGVTYDNECEMVVAACKSRRKVTVQYAGECDDGAPSGEGSGADDGCNCRLGAVCVTTLDDEDTSCVCDISCENSPPGEKICGSDGKTYGNACELMKAQCNQQKMIKITSRGSCEAACRQSQYKCCEDGVTPAKGPLRSGCPEKCNCNEFGSYEKTCNQTTGQCVCRPGVGGLKCDRCLPGYWNFVAVANKQIAGCMACRCNPLGSTRDDCDQMTGRCTCKENVSGTKCTHCVNGGVETWITNDLCEQVTQTPTSCGDLSCRAGQECVDNGSGSFECRCPTLATCNTFNGGNVCGSNGITYADECQMRVITCKSGIDVQVASEGPCIDHYEPLEELPTPPTTTKVTTTKATTTTTTAAPVPPEPTSEPETQPTPGPEPTPEPEPESTTGGTTSMDPSARPEPTTTTPLSESTVNEEHLVSAVPTAEVEPSSEPEPATDGTVSTTIESSPTSTTDETGSGCMGDDEDGCNEGSGEEESDSASQSSTEETAATTTVKADDTDEPVEEIGEKPTQAPLMFNGTADFYKAGDTRTYYTKELEDASSELFGEYNTLITSQVMELAEAEELHGKIMTFSIKKMDRKNYGFFYGTGVKVHFELGLAPGTEPSNIKATLNRLSSKDYSFETLAPAEQGNMFQHDWPYSPMDGAEEELEGFGGFVPDNKRASSPSSETSSAHGGASPSTSTDKEVVASPDTITTYEEDTEWNIPQFGGASYAEFLSIATVSATAIEMIFRSFDSEGLLFYAGTTNRDSDFISLAINKGYLEFRFDTGSGALVLRSRRPLDDGKWHRIVARRNRREGMLQVDGDTNPEHGTSPGLKRGLNLDSNVYVGGFLAVDESRINNLVGVEKGLTGCIQNVSVDNDNLVLSSSSRNCINAHRIAECGSSPCFPNKCRNAANCFITKQSEVFTNKCECKGLFEGPTCERPVTKKRIDPCITHQCHDMATCVPSDNGDGYTCLCPPGRSGSLCMGAEARVGGPSFMPAFAEDSYLQFDPLGSDVAASMTVEVLFYTSQPNGLLFYNEQKKTTRTKRDFVALNVKDGYLVFMYDLGQGMAKIRSSFPITMNEWHVARLSRDNRHGEMRVDNGQPAKGVSPNLHSELNVDQPLYLGGVPDYTKLPKATGITTGLVGAIQQFEVNGMSLSLAPGGGVEEYNVQPFNAHACFHSPCENGGTCYPRGAEFTCMCAPGFAGSRCDIRRLSGTNVDTIQRDEGESAIYFDGKSISKYRNAVKETDTKNNFFPTSRAARHNVFELVVRTTAHHGLLLMTGKAINNHDFLSITISDGRVHLRFNLGSGPAHVISEERINDNRFHVIKVEREFTTASLQVDNGLPQAVSSQGKTRELNTDGYVWIGGVDYRPRGVGHYKSFHSFVGCVSSLKIHDEAVSLRDDALNTPTLRSCLDR